MIVDAVEGRAVGTAVRPRAERLSSRKLWIAFARAASRARRRRRRRAPGVVRRQPVAARRPACGASRARSSPTTRSRSSTTTGAPFAKGLVALLRRGAPREVAGRKTSELADGLSHEVVHRDDLVVLP